MTGIPLRYAVADPPYLGRGQRHYGPGSNGRPAWRSGPVDRARGWVPGVSRTTEHPDAARWDDPATHAELVADLAARYDGWAVALAADSLPTYLAAAPTGARVAVWHRTRPPPGGSRIITAWEPVLLFVPPPRRGRNTGPSVTDVLTAAPPNSGHTGAKPRAWTRWVLDLLGVTDGDTIEDLFPGSGAVTAEIAQTVLDLTRSRERLAWWKEKEC